MKRPGLQGIGELGSGKKLIKFCMLLLIRSAGMTLLTIAEPVPCGGSLTVTACGTPAELHPVIDLEKSPARSKAVGTVTVIGSVGVMVCGFSIEMKKKALFRIKPGPPSPNLGRGSGPPKLKPGIL